MGLTLQGWLTQETGAPADPHLSGVLTRNIFLKKPSPWLLQLVCEVSTVQAEGIRCRLTPGDTGCVSHTRGAQEEGTVESAGSPAGGDQPSRPCSGMSVRPPHLEADCPVQASWPPPPRTPTSSLLPQQPWVRPGCLQSTALPRRVSQTRSRKVHSSGAMGTGTVGHPVPWGWKETHADVNPP